MVDGRPLLVAFPVFFDSMLENPNRGLMVFCRYLDGDYLQHLQQLAESRLQLLTQEPIPAATTALYHKEQNGRQSC